MIVDPAQLSPTAWYRFFISVVVPRPIAFVSTVDPGGRTNVAPFSYFCGITDQPPLLGISISRRDGQPKDTVRNIRDVGEFVVNVVNEEMLEKVVYASGDWPPETSEFDLTGLTPVASDLVKPPRVGESPVSLECRRERILELGNAFFVIGEVLRAHVKDEVLTEGRVDVRKLKPVGRLGGAEYATLGEVRRHPRPRVERPQKPAREVR
jgi:flavin reductase (DIM6/NTAB) family NADH-FMN oxidoreductase RutF